ncbi:MAG: glycosyltransferase, partial [Ferruginibacter sp.]
MIILINTASTLKGGGLQVAISFLQDCQEYPENTYHVILGAKLSTIIKTDQFPANFFFYTIDHRPATRVFSFRSHDGFFKELEKKIKPDVVFTTTGPAYWRPLAPHVIGYNLPHHIYPDSPYFDRLSLYRKLRWKVKRMLVKHFFRRDADIIVVQTDDVKERLINLLGKENVVTVSNTYSPFYNNPVIFPAKLPLRENNEFRLLTLSAWYPHKNIGVIPQIAALLSKEERDKVQFVVTLPPDIFEKEISQAYPKNIINIGPVSVKEGPSLYKECDAMFLPTLLECFSASYP